MSTTRPPSTANGESSQAPPGQSLLTEISRRGLTDLTNLLNFTKWWTKVPRRNQCKDSTSDGWDAGVDECLLAAEILKLDPEFVTDYTKGYNEAIETFVAVVKKLVR